MASTDFAVRIGDDAADDVRRAHFAAARDAVSAAGGRRVKSVGDGIMAIFSSVGAALDCAVWIQQGMEELRRRYGSEVPGVRIGVSHGEATTDEEDWYGIPVVEAARLCAQARGGQILVPDVVRAIAVHRGRYRFQPLGVVELKGLREPLEVHEVEWEPAAARPAYPAGLGTGLFVGRDAELTEIRKLWRDSGARRPRLLLLGGEPGIGKTRMAAELAREVYLSGATVIFGRCDMEATTPYQPFAEALRSYARAYESDDLADVPGVRELPRIVPEITELVGGLAEPTKADAESERFLLFEAVTELLAHASTLAPVLLVLDDLHWATAPTWLLLRHVLRSSRPSRVMLIGTYRDSELTREAADIIAALRDEAVVERLSLRGLGEDAVGEFLRSIADEELDDRAAEVTRAIHRETDGNPFFVSEVLAHLVESGVVYREGGRWTASPDVNVERLDLPAGVSEVMSRRLTRLSETSNRALIAGAVAGPLFTLKILESIPEAGPPQQILDAVEEAVSAGLVRDVGRGRFVFAHALVRQVLYGGLTSSRRMQLHLRVAEAMEATADPDEQAEALAYHFAEAAPYGPVPKAVDYALTAGRRALARLAYEEAVATLERGLAVIDLQQPVDVERRCALELELAEASWRSADMPSRNRHALAAAASAKACGRADMLGRAATLYFSSVIPGLSDPEGVALCEEALQELSDDELPLRARILSALAHYRMFGEARGVEAGPLAEDALSTARRSGDAESIAHALLVRTYSLWGSAQISDGEALLTEGVMRSQESGNVFRQLGFHSARARVRLELADIAGFEEDLAMEGALLTRGVHDYWEAGRTTMQILRACMAGRFGDADSVLTNWTFLPGDALSLDVYAGLLFVLRREQGRAQEMIALVQAATTRWPDRLALRAYLSIAHAELGDLDAARAELDVVAADGFSRVTRDITFTTALAAAAQTCAIVGATSYARPMYELLAGHAGHFAVVPTADICVGSIDRHLGILATMLEDFEGAEAHFRSALELEGRIPSPPFVARTQFWYARLCLAAGDRAHAEELLRTSMAAATDLGMAYLVSATRSLLATVSV